jgi:hypothetical protein
VIVAVGGGGIKTMQQYWERATTSVEMKSREMKENADPDSAKRRAEEIHERVIDVPDSESVMRSEPGL